MKVSLDPGSGFCFGVARAIKIAEAKLDAGETVSALGEMVHNQVEMDRLKAKGLVIIAKADLPESKGKTILFRAHGEPPETFLMAGQLGISIINATCPIVDKMQQKVRESYILGQNPPVQIVIYGKPDHPEVVGLNGNAGNSALIVSNIADIDKIDFTKPVRLFSQTTMDADSYKLIASGIKARMETNANTDLVVHKSVCGQVSGRAPLLGKFSVQHDAIIFVGGSNSSNGAYLFGICKAANEKSFYVSNIEDIDNKWFAGVETVGVTGATSTPSWLIEKVAAHISCLKC